MTGRHGKHWRALDPIDFNCLGAGSIRKRDESSLTVTPNQDKEECTVVVRTGRKAIGAIQVELFPQAQGGLELAALRWKSGPGAADLTGLRVTASNTESTAFEMTPQAGGPDSLTFVLSLTRQRPEAAGWFRLSMATTSATPLATPLPEPIRAMMEPAQWTPEQAAALSTYYRSIAPLLQPARDRIAQLSARLSKLPIVKTLVMQERQTSEQRSTHVRIRGSYLSKGERVEAGTPALFETPGVPTPADRLGLARWLVSERNPLAARVAVNRLWEQLFGRGIVDTAEDFGTQGAAATHPELLDWLAVEFVSRGWSMKSLLRLIVTSATYRQSSEVTPALLGRDPENRWLGRGPRFRLDAETIRDAALAASGLLERAVSGPPVFPYQPEGVWNQPYYKDYRWEHSEGANAYRRGIYTFWRRTAPYPSFVNFDAPSREFCAVRRIRTNTPLQALTTLNDPAFFVAAKKLAARMVASASPAARDRAELGFRLCVSRRPGAKELDQIVALFARQLGRFEADMPSARELAGITGPVAAELAAWTVVANVLLNLDEALTKE